VSNSLAIAAVTSTIRNLLYRGVNEDLSGTDVTTRPPDKARGSLTGNQVNLFLYQTTTDAAWRNHDLPGQVRPGEQGQPPLPLVLHYLVTAYAENDDDMVAHHLLGRAMGVLHDRPVIDRDDLRLALAGNDVYDQPERVRITAAPLTIEEMSKLWTTFQTQYRISAAYEASVVLIESTRPVQANPPVARRGADDRGGTAAGSAASPFPSLRTVTIPGNQPAAQPGDALVFGGTALAGTAVALRLAHPRLPAPVDVAVDPAADVTPTSIAFTVPDEPDQLPAGVYTVQTLVTGDDGVDRSSNEFPLVVGPILSSLPASVDRTGSGSATISVDVRPSVLPGQRVALLLGSRQVPVPSPAAAAAHLDIVVPNAAPGTYSVRLRVDGADSRLVDTSAQPPQFDATQQVTVNG
jgi:hypothetical protein